MRTRRVQKRFFGKPGRTQIRLGLLFLPDASSSAHILCLRLFRGDGADHTLSTPGGKQEMNGGFEAGVRQNSGTPLSGSLPAARGERGGPVYKAHIYALPRRTGAPKHFVLRPFEAGANQRMRGNLHRRQGGARRAVRGRLGEATLPKSNLRPLVLMLLLVPRVRRKNTPPGTASATAGRARTPCAPRRVPMYRDPPYLLPPPLKRQSAGRIPLTTPASARTG